MKIYQVDAFTSKPFKGNPAAVYILEGYPDKQWMLDVASEMNLSETAFIAPVREGFNLRWFTPHSEVDLCGHATLASAHILWERGYLRRDETAVFHTKSGPLSAITHGDWIQLNFPATPAREIEPPEELIAALNVQPIYAGKTIFDYLIEVDSEDIVLNISPDFTRLLKMDARGVIVTAKSEEYDFVSRFFAPRVGVPEDPVTGSSHCCLAPYWSLKLCKNRMTAYQASARGGELILRADGDRVFIEGQAITVMVGDLLG